MLNFTSELFASVSNIAGGVVKLLELLGLIDIVGILSLWPESMRMQRSRIERPETVLEGLYAGSLGALQVLGGSIFAVGAIPLQRARDSGYAGACTGALQGVSSLVAGLAAASFVLITAVAAGISIALHHRPAIAKTRPPRVFPPHLAVTPYSPHAAHAMTLLEGNTKKRLTPGALQLASEAFPLSHHRIPRARMQFATEDKRRHPGDYLLVTSDLVVYLRDGQPQWVYRKDDIARCTVEVPAFYMGAFRAQQELFLRHRERHGTVHGQTQTVMPLTEAAQLPHDQGGLYVVQITVLNKLQLSEKVLRDFSSAYKAYACHAAEKRSVVQALKKRLQLRGGVSDHGSLLRLLADDRDDLARHVVSIPSEAAVNFYSPLKQKPDMKRTEDKVSVTTPNNPKNNQFDLKAKTAPQTGCPLGWHAFIRKVLKCRRRCCFDKESDDQRSGPKSLFLKACRRLYMALRTKPLPHPDRVTLTITAADPVTALRIFDVICNISESNLPACASDYNFSGVLKDYGCS